MFTIDFSDHTDLVKDEWYEQIDSLLTFAKKQENIESDAELSVTFVDKDEIQNINKADVNKDLLFLLNHLVGNQEILQLQLLVLLERYV